MVVLWNLDEFSAFRGSALDPTRSLQDSVRLLLDVRFCLRPWRLCRTPSPPRRPGGGAKPAQSKVSDAVHDSKSEGPGFNNASGRRWTCPSSDRLSRRCPFWERSFCKRRSVRACAERTAIRAGTCFHNLAEMLSEHGCRSESHLSSDLFNRQASCLQQSLCATTTCDGEESIGLRILCRIYNSIRHTRTPSNKNKARQGEIYRIRKENASTISAMKTPRRANGLAGRQSKHRNTRQTG